MHEKYASICRPDAPRVNWPVVTMHMDDKRTIEMSPLNTLVRAIEGNYTHVKVRDKPLMMLILQAPEEFLSDLVDQGFPLDESPPEEYELESFEID